MLLEVPRPERLLPATRLMPPPPLLAAIELIELLELDVVELLDEVMALVLLLALFPIALLLLELLLVLLVLLLLLPFDPLGLTFAPRGVWLHSLQRKNEPSLHCT